MLVLTLDIRLTAAAEVSGKSWLQAVAAAGAMWLQIDKVAQEWNHLIFAFGNPIYRR